MRRQRYDSLLIAGVTIAAAVLSGAFFPPTVRYWAAFALLWALPAVAWYRCLPGEALVRGVSGLGLAFVGSSLLTLVLHLLPGAFPVRIARIAYLLPVCLLLSLTWRCGRSSPNRTREPEASLSVPRRLPWGLMVVLVIALLVRVPNLAYSEFQGDEAVVLQRAADALGGDETELFLHQKGPVEILIPMSLWALTGTINEWQARLPFVLAGLLAVFVVVALAQHWFGRRGGILAGLLVAINGFFVAFSRIVQYQNLVIAMGGLCLLWLLSAAEYNRRARPRLGVVMAAIFLAFGLLAHYDAVLFAPAAAAILWRVLMPDWRVGRLRRRIIADLACGVLSGAIVLALFYVPFVLNPMFSRTFAYLVGGRLGGSLFSNSLWDVWRMSTFYNALYYVLGIILLMVVAAVLRCGRLETWLSFGVPCFFYCFVVADPRTHVYTFFPGAAILAGAGLSALSGRLGTTPRMRGLLGGALGVWYGLCAGYIGLAFVSHTVEYKRAWPESRHPLYPVPFAADALPPYGHFGFPYRAGWKAVARLYDQGVLAGTYASNEEPEVTTWYLPNAARTHCPQPAVYAVAERVQDEVPIDWAELDRDYDLVARITVYGEPKIRVYRRADAEREVLTLHSRDARSWFDRRSTVARHRTRLPEVPHPVGTDFGSVGRLLGYELSSDAAQRGDVVRVTLFWQALSSPERNYQVFVHAMRDGELVAQHDGAPACAAAPTSLWEAGEVIRDEHTITIGATMPLGELALYAGFYDLLTFERLPVDGGPSDTRLLTRLEVMP